MQNITLSDAAWIHVKFSYDMNLTLSKPMNHVTRHTLLGPL